MSPLDEAKRVLIDEAWRAVYTAGENRRDPKSGKVSSAGTEEPKASLNWAGMLLSRLECVRQGRLTHVVILVCSTCKEYASRAYRSDISIDTDQ